MYNYSPLGKQVKQLEMVVLQRDLCRTLCSCLVVRHQNDSSSVGRLSRSYKLVYCHVGDNRWPLEVGEYQHTHEIPHEVVVISHVAAGLSCALIFLHNAVDLYIYTTLDVH